MDVDATYLVVGVINHHVEVVRDFCKGPVDVCVAGVLQRGCAHIQARTIPIPRLVVTYIDEANGRDCVTSDVGTTI